MSHTNTIFSQLLKLVPRHEFESLANQLRQRQITALLHRHLHSAQKRQIMTIFLPAARGHIAATMTDGGGTALNGMPTLTTL